MKNPKIRIESDGMRTEVYIDGKEIKRCKLLDFHADAENSIHVQWSGKIQKEDADGHLIIENDEVATEEFRYDNHKEVVL